VGVGRRAILGLAALTGLAVAIAATGLLFAHRAMRALDPPFPDEAKLMAAGGSGDLPVRLRWIDTASQAMPRSAVLEPSLDPEAEQPYVMAHTAFVLEWADGRIFLVDLGMDPEAARAFGRPLELVSGAEPIEPRGGAAEWLGDAALRVSGVAFTHLHVDHTEGAASLCGAVARTLPVFQTPLQAERSNYTTRPARAQIEAADCLSPQRLVGEPPFEVPGFPGLLVIPMAGHTPGSQVFVVHLRDQDGASAPLRTFVLTGDVVNHMDGLRLDLPKPRLYSLLVVPEATERLDRVRRYLRGLMEQHGVTPLVSHDLRQLEASRIPAWSR
jgi:glyoxylase-like metal-dependent hydrolase (beta-lactamase superfamily II)